MVQIAFPPPDGSGKWVRLRACRASSSRRATPAASSSSRASRARRARRSASTPARACATNDAAVVSNWAAVTAEFGQPSPDPITCAAAVESSPAATAAATGRNHGFGGTSTSPVTSSTPPSAAISPIRDPAETARTACCFVTPVVWVRNRSGVRNPVRCASPDIPRAGRDRYAISPAITAAPAPSNRAARACRPFTASTVRSSTPRNTNGSRDRPSNAATTRDQESTALAPTSSTSDRAAGAVVKVISQLSKTLSNHRAITTNLWTTHRRHPVGVSHGSRTHSHIRPICNCDGLW